MICVSAIFKKILFFVGWDSQVPLIDQGISLLLTSELSDGFTSVFLCQSSCINLAWLLSSREFSQICNLGCGCWVLRLMRVSHYDLSAYVRLIWFMLQSFNLRVSWIFPPAHFFLPLLYLIANEVSYWFRLDYSTAFCSHFLVLLETVSPIAAFLCFGSNLPNLYTKYHHLYFLH